MRERSISDYVPDFIEDLENKNLAPNTIHGYIMAVQSFYTFYDIQFPRHKSIETTVLETNIEIPTKEDIQAILKVCDPLEKAIVLVGVSSGLSMNEIINLKVGNFKARHDSTTGITTLTLRRGKTKVDFTTFLTKEASQAVNEYLEFRSRTSDSTDIRKQNQLLKQHVYSDTDYLFIGRTIPKAWLDTKDESLRKLERNSFLKIYRMINEKARKSTPKGTWNIIRSHNIRKYFDSTLKNEGCDSFNVEFWMGHKLNATQAAYFRANPDKQRELYSKYVPYLTIQKDIDMMPEIERLREELQAANAKGEKYDILKSEIAELLDNYDDEQLAAMEKADNEYRKQQNSEPVLKDLTKCIIEDTKILKELYKTE
jgi:integrase